MPASRRRLPNVNPRAGLPDAALIDLVQRQTFRFFWEGAHPVCGLARDRSGLATDPADDLVGTGGSGFVVMAIIVAAERGWITGTKQRTVSPSCSVFWNGRHVSMACSRIT